VLPHPRRSTPVRDRRGPHGRGCGAQAAAGVRVAAALVRGPGGDSEQGVRNRPEALGRGSDPYRCRGAARDRRGRRGRGAAEGSRQAYVRPIGRGDQGGHQLDPDGTHGQREEDEARLVPAHPWLGVLMLFGLRGYGEIPYRGMIVAYEHHMKTDLTGYPKSLRGRDLSIYSKIVAVADGFDAATSRRVYQTVPIQPDQVLKEMWENPRRGYDQTVVKAFINLIGIYPVGTCIILDTYEVALVHSANPDVTHVHRPVVRIVTTPEGGVQHPGFLADLAQKDADGHFPRSIVKVTDPAKYGINVSDYFV